MDRKPIWKPTLIAVAAAIGIAVLGASMTDLGSWYQGLKLPPWQPPGPVFGIVWTTIYALTATAAVLGWRNTSDRRGQDWLIILFCLNGFLNVLWSILFFQIKRPDWALIEVVPFWISIVALMVFLWPRTRLGALLIVPYVVWVSIATALNYEVVRLNGPFV
jgi:translocator protein